MAGKTEDKNGSGEKPEASEFNERIELQELGAGTPQSQARFVEARIRLSEAQQKLRTMGKTNP